ncbi:MAG: excinuclease ABC subunit UvrA, partial [Eubacterium sp.]|nr:excinuclease ABC subunit UvrA [Eubacterium sp.]
MIKNITVKGAREHNLKNIDIEIPRDKLVVFTGLSGSGKSSLAFDTIYAEGQRRYVESLSSYARMFLGQMEKPDVDYIEGLSPAISIDQKTTSKNPRSTVGTVTEIYDYLRLLWARIGIPHCTVCGREITQQTVDQIVDKVMELPEGTRFQVMAPIARGKKGEYVKELADASKQGFVRARIDGEMYDLADDIKLEKNIKHNIEIVVDRLVLKPEIKSRLSDSIETATRLSDGIVLINIADRDNPRDELFSLNYACPEHGVSIEEMSPRMFSFNNPFGACPKCDGLGIFKEIDEDLIIPDKKLSINQGAIKASGWNVAEGGSIARMYLDALAREYNFSLDMPVEMLGEDAVRVILYGTKGRKIKMKRVTSYGSGTYMNDFEGVICNLQRRYKETSSDYARTEIESVMRDCKCNDCKGARLKPQSLAVTVGGLNIYEFCKLSINEELEFIDNLKLNEKEQMIGKLVIRRYITFLEGIQDAFDGRVLCAEGCHLYKDRVSG